jgi:unsaturated rhamnogalacturonyl hydrolase
VTNHDEILVGVTRAMLSMQRHSWEQGVAAQACFEAGDSAMGILLAREAVHRQAPDGRLALTNGNDSVDPGVNGGPVLRAYALTNDDVFKHAADRMADWFLRRAPRTAEGILYHNVTERKTLVDGIYHIAPFLAQAGYYDEALFQIEGFRRIHLDPQEKLYSQYWDDKRKDFERTAFWGGGQGWMAGALARVLGTLPESMADTRARLVGYLQELVDACLQYQRDDGLFHDVFDDTTTFVETTAGLMLSYAIYRGIAGGWLASAYQPAADRMRLAGFAKVDANGYVQGACGAPDFRRVGTSAEAQAFLILSQAAYRDLVGQQR